MSMGQFEFENSCAVCHGASGKGDGPAADFFFQGATPDLTALQKNNGGVFPVARIYEVIDGSEEEEMLMHGSRQMPIWGKRYMRRIEEGGGFDPFSAEEKEIYVRTRILALIEYLSTLQEN